MVNPPPAPFVRIDCTLLKGLFNKPFRAIFSLLSIIGFSAAHGSSCFLIGYNVKPAAWIDNGHAAYMGVLSGLCLTPMSAVAFIWALGQFEYTCVLAEAARQRWLSKIMSGVEEDKDWATIKAGESLQKSNSPEKRAWAVLIPIALFLLPVHALQGAAAGAIGGPLTGFDTARSALIRATIGGGIVGGGLFVLFVWVSIFLFSIEAKPPVLKPKQVTGEVAAEAGQVSAPPSYKEQGDKSRRGSMVKDVNEGLGRPASVAGGDDTTAKNVLSESKKERMRDYLGSEDSVNSYAAALAASTIGSQTSSFDRPYSVNNKRDSAASTNFNRRQDSFSRRDSQASMSSETALYKDSVQPLGRSHRFRDSGSSITLRGQGEIPESARSQGTVIV